MFYNNKIRKKKSFTNSIEPLKKEYFISFIIWKLSLYNMHRGLFFLDNLFQRKVRKNLKKFTNQSQRKYIILSFFVLFLGSIQIFSEYTGTPILLLLKSNLPIYNRQKFNYNWKTFHIINYSNFFEQYPLSYPYKNINILNDAVLLQLNSFYQNQQNRIFNSYILLNQSLSNNSGLAFFESTRYPFAINDIKMHILDTIPKKMEGIKNYRNPRRVLLPLFQSSSKKITEVPLIKGSPTSSLKQKTRNTFKLLNKLRIVKENDQNLVWEKPIDSRKTLIKKSKNLKKFFTQVKLKNIISKNCRSFFYEEEFKHIDPSIFDSTQLKNLDKPSSIYYRVIEEDLNYLDILNLVNEKELSFSHKNIKPRHFSGYWFPDFKNKKKFTFYSLKPSLIHVKLPGKYKLFFEIGRASCRERV